jgi:hypothetical protein
LSSHTPAHGLSRRNLLRAGAATAASAPVWAGVAAPSLLSTASASLPLVKPKWSEAAFQAFGVNAMPNHGKTSYHYTDQWMASLDSIGISYLRGCWAKGLDATYNTAGLARKYGMRWGMIVIDDVKMTDAAITATVADIAAKGADLCMYVEGVNEPNGPRNLGYIPSDWRQRTLQQQKVLYQAVKSHANLSHVAILGPSLQMKRTTTSDWQWFAANGLMNYMTHSGTHYYPGGFYPDHGMDATLAPMKKYWPKPVWITETGYTNALATTAGHHPVPEDVAAVYAPHTLLEAVDRGYHTAFFETLDDPDPGAKDQIEANFGLWAIESGEAPPWRPKPIVSSLRTFLTGLRDPGATYTPPSIGLQVSASSPDVRWTALGKRDGSVRLYLRRAKECWDPIKQVRVSVPQVPTKITTNSGSQTVQVGSQLVVVKL